jgi:hypothetical protein
MDHPRVFICHASDDKERFVLRFYEALRSRGVNAWLDKYEMLPGDSLVDKVFEEGIPSAQAVIVVVSEFSINKPWVREELNAAAIRRINGESRLIPVVIGQIDESQIPEVLKSTLWERIQDLDNVDADLERIVMSIYEHRERPPLGDPPAYASSSPAPVPGLSELDSLVLKLSCEYLIQTQSHREEHISIQNIGEIVEVMDIHPDMLQEALEILDGEGYIKGMSAHGTGIIGFMVTDLGFDKYARKYMPGFEDESLHKAVALRVVNHDAKHSEEIARGLEVPPIVVEHILAVFKQMNDMTVTFIGGGGAFVLDTGPKLRRWLRENS